MGDKSPKHQAKAAKKSIKEKRQDKKTKMESKGKGSMMPL